MWYWRLCQNESRPKDANSPSSCHWVYYLHLYLHDERRQSQYRNIKFKGETRLPNPSFTYPHKTMLQPAYCAFSNFPISRALKLYLLFSYLLAVGPLTCWKILLANSILIWLLEALLLELANVFTLSRTWYTDVLRLNHKLISLLFCWKYFEIFCSVSLLGNIICQDRQDKLAFEMGGLCNDILYIVVFLVSLIGKFNNKLYTVVFLVSMIRKFNTLPIQCSITMT